MGVETKKGGREELVSYQRLQGTPTRNASPELQKPTLPANFALVFSTTSNGKTKTG
jgi:hypothetical protein